MITCVPNATESVPTLCVLYMCSALPLSVEALDIASYQVKCLEEGLDQFMSTGATEKVLHSCTPSTHIIS